MSHSSPRAASRGKSALSPTLPHFFSLWSPETLPNLQNILPSLLQLGCKYNSVHSLWTQAIYSVCAHKVMKAKRKLQPSVQFKEEITNFRDHWLFPSW